MNRLTLASLLGLALLSLSACNRAQLAGPPELRLGRDECKECGMLVNEDRCSSAMLVDQDGRHVHLVFDDIGCMLDMDPAKADITSIIDVYVHDFSTKAWVRSTDAQFLCTDPKALHTPMGSGMVAFMHRADAEAAQKQHGGQILSYDQLHAARKQFMEQRYGKPNH